MNRIFRLSFLAGIINFPAQAYAEQVPAQMDIIGLRLGMTVAKANEILHAYNAKMRTVTLYSLPSGGAFAPSDYAFANAKYKAPSAINAALITQALDLNGKDITDESDVSKLVYSLSGEWYNLEFTPSDKGGKLYAIARVVKYPTPGSADELKRKFADKYGKPSAVSPSGVDPVYLFDARGRMLSQHSGDFSRCSTRDLASANSGAYNFEYHGGKSWKEIHDEYAGGKIDVTTQSFADAGVQNSDPQYRRCGIELEIYIHNGDQLGHTVDFFSVKLTDQNAVYFDNGIRSFWEQKLTPPAAVPAPKL